MVTDSQRLSTTLRRKPLEPRHLLRIETGTGSELGILGRQDVEFLHIFRGQACDTLAHSLDESIRSRVAEVVSVHVMYYFVPGSTEALGASDAPSAE